MSFDSSRKLETPEQRYSRLALESECKQIGKALAHVMPEGVGFCFFMFNLGPGGATAYLSNAKRADMVKLLNEFLGKMSDT